VTEAELRNLLARTEDEAIECKPKLLRRHEIAEYAVGIGNAGGGWLIMGVSDRIPRRVLPLEIPSFTELTRIQESVADAAQIHIKIDIVPTQDGSVLVVRVPSRPRGMLFHTRDGKYLIRLGEGLRGMTVPEIDAIRQEAGMELTSQLVPGRLSGLLSLAAMEEMRHLMEEAGTSSDLIQLPDMDLLRSLGLLSGDGNLLIAGLLLVGKQEAIRAHAPNAQWQFRRMKSDTEYDQAEEGFDSVVIALKRLRDLVAANNPIVTIPGWLVHPEFPRYPTLALRELAVNALVHRDYTVPGAVSLKLYPDRLELSNPGGFVGGVTPQNILHHPSSPRYPTLFQALARIRLANAANLGVPRVYRELLSEGKEPPIYWSSSHAIRVTIKGQEARREFLELVYRYPGLDVDHMLVLHYLTRHREITARIAAEICQRSVEMAREILGQLVTQRGLLEPGGGSGRGRYYRLSRAAYEVLIGTLDYHVDRRLTAENAKARVLAALADRTLTNADIREITQLSRYQTVRLMASLREEGLVEIYGFRRGARWHLCEKT